MILQYLRSNRHFEKEIPLGQLMLRVALVQLRMGFDISKPGTLDIFNTLSLFQVTQQLRNAESLGKRLVPANLFLGPESFARTEENIPFCLAKQECFQS